jgi:hypothetical protein
MATPHPVPQGFAVSCTLPCGGGVLLLDCLCGGTRNLLETQSLILIFYFDPYYTFVLPYGTVPYRTVPYRTVPYRLPIQPLGRFDIVLGGPAKRARTEN